jgi:hypothetical protein
MLFFLCVTKIKLFYFIDIIFVSLFVDAYRYHSHIMYIGMGKSMHIFSYIFSINNRDIVHPNTAFLDRYIWLIQKFRNEHEGNFVKPTAWPQHYGFS